MAEYITEPTILSETLTRLNVAITEEEAALILGYCTQGNGYGYYLRGDSLYEVDLCSHEPDEPVDIYWLMEKTIRLNEELLSESAEESEDKLEQLLKDQCTLDLMWERVAVPHYAALKEGGI